MKSIKEGVSQLESRTYPVNLRGSLLFKKKETDKRGFHLLLLFHALMCE